MQLVLLLAICYVCLMRNQNKKTHMLQCAVRSLCLMVLLVACGQPNPMAGKVDMRKTTLPEDLLDALNDDDDLSQEIELDPEEPEMDPLWQGAGKIAVETCGKHVLRTDGLGKEPLSLKTIYDVLCREEAYDCTAERRAFEKCFDEFAIPQQCDALWKCLGSEYRELKANPICQSVFANFYDADKYDSFEQSLEQPTKASGWLAHSIQVVQTISQPIGALFEQGYQSIVQSWRFLVEKSQDLYHYLVG